MFAKRLLYWPPVNKSFNGVVLFGWLVVQSVIFIFVNGIITDYDLFLQSMGKKTTRCSPTMILEKRYSASGVPVLGVDEVGRGALAGPVVACAVYVDPLSEGELQQLGVRDSKCLSAKKREALYSVLSSRPAVAYSFGCVDAKGVDSSGIVQATMDAMRQGLTRVIERRFRDVQPHILVDGKDQIPEISSPQTPVVAGDFSVLSIAVASVLAKVYRDSMMTGYGEQYPEYGFEGHKGYGSSAHIAALQRHGSCELHRQSFISSF